jgi:hypothetical protein
MTLNKYVNIRSATSPICIHRCTPPKEEVVFLFSIGSKMILSVRRLVQKIKVIVKPALKVQVLLPPLLEDGAQLHPASRSLQPKA